MQPRRGRTILVVEDELEVRGYFQMALKCLGYSVELAQDGDEVLSYLRDSSNEIDAVLLDIMMPNRDGFETLQDIREFNPDLPVIMVSGAASSMNIVTAMKTGATDFLCKPVAHEDLRKAIGRALERNGGSYAPPVRISTPATGAFLGNNPRMREIQALVGQIGWSEAPVLIQGETGSGKEVLARELHARSPRSGKPFLKLNCAALPSELVESELFGYERGAFTGAFQRKAGMFEMADGGTILLDEIGDMELRLQAKLLHVLQDREFQRIGGKETIKVDVRVISASHRDLETAIGDGEFREDLFYRLNVVSLHVPPLRDRREDILPLAEFLLKRHAIKGFEPPTISADLKQALRHYHWPGNVRELENTVRKLTILRDPAVITRDLNVRIQRRQVVTAPAAPIEAPVGLKAVTKANQQAQIEAIMAALHSARWNRKQAAALLGIDYKALLYKMKKFGVDAKPAPGTAEPAPPKIMSARAD